ncbi:hypothetical protein D3C76_1137720 [compost metagenome]
MHGLFRPHEHLGAVDRGSERHAFFLDLAHGTQAEHLETTGVSQDRAFPLHEIMQVAMGLDHFHARAQPQVEGIAKDDVGAGGLDVPGQHALDRAIGAHRHERRGLDHATGEGQATTTRFTVGGQQLKGHTTGAGHAGSSGAISLGACGAGLRVMNMASP